MRLHILAAGQADAIVLELPSGRLAVIDFGHRQLIEYLGELDPIGTRRFAFCLLTHAHHDHYACLKEFIDRYDSRVDEYWFSYCNAGAVGALLSLQAAIAEDQRGRLLVQDLSAARPFELEPEIEITVFAPSTREVMRPPGGSSENDRSVVLLVRHGSGAILLGADAGEVRWTRIEGQARAAGISLAADVVKAPHHGAPPPRGLPERLWPVLLRTPESVVMLTVGRQPDRPALATIESARRFGRIRCTGRSLTCALANAEVPNRASMVDGDLISRSLAPAPEARQAPACFGTQVYDVNADGTLRVVRADTPLFLDACLV